MKRVGLQRRSPLRAKSWGVNPVSRKKTVKVAAYRHLRALVHAREGGCCAACGVSVAITEGHGHHRLYRSRGGADDATNCVWLCPDDHRAGHEGPQRVMVARGWVVPSWADPAQWPVLRTHHGVTGWFQPSETGWAPTQPNPSQTNGDTP